MLGRVGALQRGDVEGMVGTFEAGGLGIYVYWLCERWKEDTPPDLVGIEFQRKR